MARELGGEGVVMGCEETCAANVRCDVMEDGLCDCHTIIRTCTAAKLVEDDKRARCGFGKDLFCLREFDEEGALGGKYIVVGSQAGHDAIDWSQRGGDTWDIASYLSHDDRDTSLSSVSNEK